MLRRWLRRQNGGEGAEFIHKQSGFGGGEGWTERF